MCLIFETSAFMMMIVYSLIPFKLSIMFIRGYIFPAPVGFANPNRAESGNFLNSNCSGLFREFRSLIPETTCHPADRIHPGKNRMRRSRLNNLAIHLSDHLAFCFSSIYQIIAAFYGFEVFFELCADGSNFGKMRKFATKVCDNSN